MAIKRTLGGLISFFASLLGGHLLNVIQANGNTVFGIPMYAQQFLALMSLLLYIPAFFLQNKYVAKPIESIIKERE